MYAAYGSEVTVIEHHRQILGQEDDDVAASARDILRDVGITVITEAEVVRVEDGPGGSGDGLLRARREHRIGAGRRHPGGDWPQAGDGGLGLAEAGIRLAAGGAVAVDEHLRTSQPHVFAVGDVNGGPQFTYVSLDDYRIVLDQLVGAGARAAPQTGWPCPTRCS